MLRWAQCSFHKMQVGTSYTELVFLHPLGSIGHVVHSSVSGARNGDALFFTHRWAWCDIHKKRTRAHYAELVLLHLMGFARHIVHSSVSRP
jgi:hypothetical protein